MTDNTRHETLRELLAKGLAELIEHLHGILSKARKAGTALPVDMLEVARKTYRDQARAIRSRTEKEEAKLRDLYRLYVEAMLRAMKAEKQPAGLLAEARLFLHQQGVSKDLGGAVSTASALEVLGSDMLPFKTTQ